MDVIKKSLFVLLTLSLMNCSNNATSDGDGKFKRTGAGGCDGQAIPNEYLVRWSDGSISIENYSDDESFVTEFVEKNKKQIISSEPHYRIQISERETLHQRDWGGGVNWGMESIQAEGAWNKNTLGENIIVAIIDSGLDGNHPELANTLAINENEEINGLDDDGNGLIDDRYGYDFVNRSHVVTDHTGHGTHIAGVIAASHSEGSITGVAPNVKLLPLNFIGKGGSGDVFGAISAMKYAALRGAKIINASWGGNSCSLELHDEIVELAAKNILFVTAAGNSGNNISSLPEYPAAFVLDNQITVGASTYDNRTAGFSNYGELVDLVAPGANIVSTYPMEYDYEDGVRDGLVALDGTSMAAPFVTATAALLWSQKPDASYIEIKQALLNGVESGPYPVKTRGLLNVVGAFNALTF